MGAAVFHVCYGVRREIDADDSETVELLERRQHPWQLAAKCHRMQSWWGQTTNQHRYFLLVGRIVGQFGWEHSSAAQLGDSEVLALMAETSENLRNSDIDGQPVWHFQFEPDR